MSEKNAPKSGQQSETNLVLQFDRKTAAKMLGYSPATFDRLRERRLIKANVATGRPRFTLKELQRFVEESCE